jgi:DinB family protein
MDTTPLRDAYRALLDAADATADADTTPPPGEWDVDQVLAHVSLVGAATLAAAARVAAGERPAYDNRIAHDPWMIGRAIALAGGRPGLRERIRGQGEALRALCAAGLSDAELDTEVPSLLLSHGEVLVDRPLPLRDILTGLAGVELPGHTAQLLALRPARSREPLPTTG